MIHAYQETLVNRVQRVIGEIFDYAINVKGIPGEDFVKIFLASTASKKIENGEPLYLQGKSGIEIADEIIEESKFRNQHSELLCERPNNDSAYWIGWIVAYYQWYSDRKFSEIFNSISYKDLDRMYFTLHEADITKARDIIDAKIKETFKETNLKRIRTMCKITQKELSAKSSVSLRSIQMYEERNKDINKASTETVYALSKALGCKVEDLIEKNRV